MTKIYVYDTYCKIEGEEDLEFLHELDDELSFFVQGAEHTKAFKGYFSNGKFVKWDGRKHLLSNKLEFGPGLLNRVQGIYDLSEKEYEIVDKKAAESNSKPINISKKLKKIKKEPYPYQTDAVNEVIKHKRGIIRIPTGGGKSLVAALLTAEIGKKTIIYVIGKDLLYQIHSLFSSIFGKVGIIGDGKCQIENINIATIWTVGQALGLKIKRSQEEIDGEKKISKDKYESIRDLLNETSVHIYDECHLAACNTIQDIVRNIRPEHIYGMSASPWRDDGADLMIESILGNVIFNISSSYLIDNGFLAKPIIKFITVPKLDESLPNQYQTIYRKYIVENEQRNEMVAKGAERLVEQGYKTLVLYSSIEHGERLFEKISSRLPCVLLSGKDNNEDRDAAKQKLDSGEISCIIASRIFDIGVDLPALSGLIIASSGKSSVRALQRIGRVIRKYPGKKQAAILDFNDQAKFLDKHSLARRKIYNSEERFEVIWPQKGRSAK